jgi:purine-nucleoside phosphorylase
MKTPHINAEKEDIADVVLMPGDPLRAKMIAETYLEDCKLVNEVRNMLAYTGFYKGRRVTVMGSGMGMASMGIYCYELFKFYDVDSIIRIGSCGSFQEKVKVMDLVLVEEAFTHSNFSKSQNNSDLNLMKANSELNAAIKEVALKASSELHLGTIHCSDIFYNDNDNMKKLVEEHGSLGVEMESYALFHYAHFLGKKAACLLTVSDSLVTGEELPSIDRQTKFEEMFVIALESTLLL